MNINISDVSKKKSSPDEEALLKLKQEVEDFLKEIESAQGTEKNISTEIQSEKSEKKIKLSVKQELAVLHISLIEKTYRIREEIQEQENLQKNEKKYGVLIKNQ